MRKLHNQIVQAAGTGSFQYLQNSFFHRRVDGYDHGDLLSDEALVQPPMMPDAVQ
jgi:hypothetical protein